MIKLVIFDADETIWTCYGYWTSLLVPPLEKVNDNEIKDSEGKRITLFDGVRQMLETLNDREILISLASFNDREPNRVTECLELFEIDHFFIYPQVDWNDKGQNIKKVLNLLQENNGKKLNYSEVLFVDDLLPFINKVAAACPGIRTLHIGSDISKVTEIMGFL